MSFRSKALGLPDRTDHSRSVLRDAFLLIPLNRPGLKREPLSRVRPLLEIRAEHAGDIVLYILSADRSAIPQ
jgi:hypothetical protein